MEAAVAVGGAGGRGARSAGRVRRGGGGAVAAAAAAGERASVCARAGRAGWAQEFAADAVSARGDAGAVRVGAAVSGRLALGAGAAGARRARSGWRREIGVVAWVVDDTGIVKDGKHSPGVKRQYSGTLGKIGNCQITVSVHAVGERGTLPLGWRLYLPEEWCEDLAAPAEGEDPGRGRLQDEAAARRRSLRARRPAWQMPTGADPRRLRLRRRQRLPHASCTRSELEYVRRRPRGDERLRARDDLRGARSATAAPVGRARSPAPTASPSRCARSPSGCRRGLADAPLPHNPGGRGCREPLRLRPRRRHPPRPQRQPAAALRSG